MLFVSIILSNTVHFNASCFRGLNLCTLCILYICCSFYSDSDPQMINEPHVTYSVQIAPCKYGVAEKQYCLLVFVRIKKATPGLF